MKYDEILIKEATIDSVDAKEMMRMLSSSLKNITGNSGKNSFDPESFSEKGNVFLLAYHKDEAIGCGAIRRVDNKTAEMKRVYAKYKGCGIGKKLVTALECKAIDEGYEKLILETRKVNTDAVGFYIAMGYSTIENYGKYVGRQDAICFEKTLL
ncbi:MAG: GNAT family N-acetyltransferase [Clostridia bacterium]|nr:GNAT family N-acetyltransferase [Clostridia bacterium]